MQRLLFVLPALVFTACGGGEGDTQKFWQEVVLQLLELVLVIATPVVLLLVRKAIQVAEKKFDFDIEERHQTQLDELVLKGIALAREQSRKALRAGKDPLPGQDKKRIALSYVTRTLDQSSIPHKGAEYLEELIEAKLNLDRQPEDREKAGQ